MELSQKFKFSLNNDDRIGHNYTNTVTYIWWMPVYLIYLLDSLMVKISTSKMCYWYLQFLTNSLPGDNYILWYIHKKRKKKILLSVSVSWFVQGLCGFNFWMMPTSQEGQKQRQRQTETAVGVFFLHWCKKYHSRSWYSLYLSLTFNLKKLLAGILR